MTPRRVRGRVLVVEDEAYVRDSLGQLLRSRGFDVDLVESAASALAHLGKTPVDLVLTDLTMPGESGLGLLRRIRQSSKDVPVVVLTGYGTVASAVECLKAGAADYILKPADPEALEVACDRALRRRALEREVDYLRNPGPELEWPLGESPGWRETLRMLRAVAPTDSTVLITGESGTGKEVLARLVHRLSQRSGRAFVVVNCAAVPLEMWESEFFGHRRGAFTGASADREGRFRLAHEGTLFVDEIGAMSLAAQAKVLRVIQEGEFHRLGDEQPMRVDVRIVAATNTDLERDVREGRFRADLYYRLNVVRIQVPPLRERKEDIAPLAAHFLSEVALRLRRAPPALSKEALAELLAYDWPGNVRELRNVIERTLTLDPDGGLAGFNLSPVQGSAAGAARNEPFDDLDLRLALGRSERAVVVEALRRAGGVRKEAARLLGIDPRNLGYYLKKHAIDPDAPA
ncbi:MAG TPA: sigma-54 dependent transcriptional regulator [Vicinamibacteria bacterium]|jgi:DNA-binding NtrC family response regulator|nr:sigma-54 dependent transcriptional regulator [Vicinamibacteria bacterium]